MATPSPFAIWLHAARPRTLPAAIAPVLVGTGLAIADGKFAFLPALAALAGSLLLQIAVNLANDYFDGVRGLDTPDRRGPLRVTASGLLPAYQVRRGVFIIILATMILGLYLIWVGGWFIAAIGVAAILSALAYSGGPFPLASHGLGDLFVFIFFGLAAVVGTYYVQALQITWPAILAAIPVGTLTVAIIIANNLRDIETDARVGKRTLAVILGANGARVEYVAMLILAYATPILFFALGWASFWILAPMLSLPLAWQLTHDLYAATQPREQIALLAATARLDLIFSALFALGLVMR